MPYCSLRIAFQSKFNATYYKELERHFFARATECLGMTPLTGKRVKNLKMSATFDHILLKGHDASFEEFTIFFEGNNKLKLHLKEFFLIKCGKPELNKNSYSYPLEPFN